MENKLLKTAIKYTLEEELKKHPDIKMSDLTMLKEWCEKQKHLPAFPDEYLILFLHSNYGSMEAAKNTVENFFTLRTMIPEFFADRDPFGSKELRTAMNVAVVYGLPEETKEGYQVFYGKILDPDANNYYFIESVKYFFMVADLHVLHYGTRDGIIVVADAKDVSFGHVSRINPISLKKLVTYVQEAIPVRLKAVHFINTPPALDLVMSMVKPFMKKELWNLIKLHSSLHTLEESVPLRILPKDIGGEAISSKELQAIARKELEDYREWFIEEERLRVDESLRVGKGKTAGDLFGVDGSFKKLDFD